MRARDRSATNGRMRTKLSPVGRHLVLLSIYYIALAFVIGVAWRYTPPIDPDRQNRVREGAMLDTILTNGRGSATPEARDRQRVPSLRALAEPGRCAGISLRGQVVGRSGPRCGRPGRVRMGN